MEKTRNVNQVVNQTKIDFDEDDNKGKVPLEFLTSDDFQVVQRKRHHSKKSPDESDDVSRSNSNRFTNCEENHNCHSSFWAIRSQNVANEEVNEEVEKIVKSDGNEVVQTSNPDKSIDNCSIASRYGCTEEVDSDSRNSTSREKNQSIEEIENFLYSKESLCNVLVSDICSASSKVNVEVSKKQQSENVKWNSELLESCDHEKTSREAKAENFVPLISNMEKNFEVFNSEENADNLRKLANAIDSSGANPSLFNSTDQEKLDCMEMDKLPEINAKSQKSKKRSKQKRNERGDPGTNNQMKFSSYETQTNVLASNSSPEFSEIPSCSVKGKAEQGRKGEHAQRDRKRPSKKQLEAIHEALRKAKEDEETRKQEEETKQRLAEEAERLAQEKLKAELEKKEKKKLKEKQRKEKMRAEGRLLSKSQKQSRARLAATLDALRQQGVDVPQIGEKRPRGPRLGNYKASNRKRIDSSQSDRSVASKPERHKSESLSSQGSSGKDSFPDLPNSFDSKDSFDLNGFEMSAVTTEYESGHLSCSEESDVLYEDISRAAESSTEIIATKIKESLEKSNLSKLKSSDVIRDTEGIIKLRSPVVCVLGHVDTGKTKILDFIRKTHVQDSEAGGITQQIGATMIPQDALREKCKMVKDFSSFEMKVPGLLVIDTPGHESFRNLRSRGTSVCDIAILVVDIMHGLEPQTLESINLLKTGRIPFVVALNKIDRLYGWKSIKSEDIETVINSQSANTLLEFKKRCQDIIFQFANQCLNAVTFYENKDPRTYVSMIPTSAITGDGMGNLLSLVTQLTQSLMHKRLVYNQELHATVLEVKVIAGLGTTIDVILVNGRLQEGDTIVLAGQEGPIVTQIRSLLMPHPLKELRVKNPYVEYKFVEGSQGVKITAKDLDKSIAGLPLFVAQIPSKVELLKSEVISLMNQSINSIKTSERGVYVQASTLGSLEALLEYLASLDIPYFGVKIGPVVKKDVMKASIMLEHDIQYATILAFDVKIERDAQELADSLGVKVFHANIIYHLFDQFLEHREEILKKRNEARTLAVFPCILQFLAVGASDVLDSIIIDVSVEAGTLRQGTPLCVPTRGNMEIGTVTEIKVGGKLTTCAKEGEKASIKMFADPVPNVKQLDEEDYLVSRINRQSIDICKEYYRDELDSTDWHLMAELKKMLHMHG